MKFGLYNFLIFAISLVLYRIGDVEINQGDLIMTKREGAILSAFTGNLLCDFSALHTYVEEILNRPVFTHEFGNKDIVEEIKNASYEDFMDLVENQAD